MEKYLVISEHTQQDCDMAIEHFRTYHKNFLTHFDWGCKDDDHRAYAMIEADNHEHAKMSVPPAFRGKARAILLARFTEDDFEGDITKDQAAS